MTYELLELEKKSNGIVIMRLKQIIFNQKFVRELNAALDELEKIEGQLALITTSTHKKIYSAGLDFKVFDAHFGDTYGFICEFCRFLGRFMRLGFPTIAAMDGHCHAGGFMFAMAHDYRLFREKGVTMSMSEIKLNIPIPKNMMGPLLAKMKKPALREICLFGEKMAGPKLLHYEIVDFIYPQVI